MPRPEGCHGPHIAFGHSRSRSGQHRTTPVICVCPCVCVHAQPGDRPPKKGARGFRDVEGSLKRANGRSKPATAHFYTMFLCLLCLGRCLCVGVWGCLCVGGCVPCGPWRPGKLNKVSARKAPSSLEKKKQPQFAQLSFHLHTAQFFQEHT